MEEKRVDMRKRTPEEAALYVRQNELLHQFNHTLGRTEESREILKELLGDRIGENTVLAPPLYGAALEELRVGDRVFINSNLLAMARHAIVGAASVVTHDVGDYEVVAGNPAKCIRKLDPDRFPPETEK